AADKEQREKIEKVNQADSLVFQTEKQLKEYGDKLSADKKATIETALNKLKEAHKAQDVAQIDAGVAELNAAWTAASEEMYKATQGAQPNGEHAQGQPQGQGSGNTGEGGVTDAEFEEVK
ncbi:MAG TPA: Hsp70 family protein, partial [Chitinophaga sp.]